MAAAAISMYKYESDLRSNEHHLSSSENKARKKFRPVRDLNSSIFIYFSVVHIYDFHIFILHGFIRNRRHDQLPVGSSAQLVERYTDIAEVKGSSPDRPDFLSGRRFTTT